ncbi:MAG: flagellar hook-length control protein FliK [Bryobacteraceae bacterium]|nr:flagellar hook-length control protein FliK [Bryobacteraceae bacterium]
MKVERGGGPLKASGAPERGEKTGKFEELLREKSKRREAEEPAPPPMPAPATAGFQTAGAEETAPAAAPVLPPMLTELVETMVSKVESLSPHEVRIEFEPGTLDGLKVTLERHGESLEIRFDATPPVARLLEAHAGGLREALEMRGFDAAITVSRDGGGSRGGRERERRQSEEQDS